MDLLEAGREASNKTPKVREAGKFNYAGKY